MAEDAGSPGLEDARKRSSSSSGLVLKPDATFADCGRLDVICVPGGAGINPLLADEETLAFLRRQAEGARFVTSVCTGALVLGAAGLLIGKRATTHWASHDLLAPLGAIPVRERIVRDGRLMTGGGVTAGIDFGLALIAELAGDATAEAIQLSLEYAPAPPFRRWRAGHARRRAVLAGGREADGADHRRAREARRRGGEAARPRRLTGGQPRPSAPLRRSVPSAQRER